MRYKYFMTISYYPVNDYLSTHLPIAVGINTPLITVDINMDRWEQTKVFNSHEEYEYWKDDHPWGWNVMKVNKIEEIE